MAEEERNMLFWSDEQRDAGFRAMDQLAPHHVIVAGTSPRPLPAGAPLAIDVDDYIERQHVAGLIVLHNGAVVLERYARGFDATERWTSFSVAKSFTSTLAGAALRDGAIASLDDAVTRYIPDLHGSAYDTVSVRQLLTMTSGVRWNEDYGDRNSDVSRFTAARADPGVNETVSYMRRLPAEAAPGTQWVYKTGETNLIGVLVSSATGRTLSDYCSEKIWQPAGMEADGIWLTDSTGHEISGCCISARLRDYARFGQFVLEGGHGVVPADWFAQATRKHADIGLPGHGYGYQWWTYDDGCYAARGIFGQGIFVDPARRLVIAANGNWPVARDDAGVGAEREAFYQRVRRALS
jgi:CubicO group peptidase (beta-lactamase class C family)